MQRSLAVLCFAIAGMALGLGWYSQALKPLQLSAQSPGQSAGVVPPSPPSVSPSPSPQSDRTLQFLKQRARSITVKVLAGQSWGSGILVQRQQREYVVLTNHHVLQAGEGYQIQTPDGKIYPAVPYPVEPFQPNDLALLKFQSPKQYAIASWGQSLNLRVGSMVFAAGFPFQTEPQQDRDGFQFTRGQVSLIMDKAFEGGYQVGYSNRVVKGMSGGPVLNSQGMLVAVNGMHAYPLWGDPYVFVDGSHPPSQLKGLLIRSSWAIPVETVLKLAPRSLQLASSDRKY